MFLRVFMRVYFCAAYCVINDDDDDSKLSSCAL